MAQRFTKSDIDFHSTTPSGHRPVPAVNVKVRGGGYIRDIALPLELGRVSDDGGKTYKSVTTHPLFTHDWIEENTTEDDQQAAWESAIESAWDMLKDEAERIYGAGRRVYSEGRSGGWAYIDGFSAEDVETWDAIAVARWGRFARFARACADDVPRNIVDFLYANVFEPWLEEQRTDATEAIADTVSADRVRTYATKGA